MTDEDQVFQKLRKEMVERQLMPRGIHDAATLASMSEVPRHLFVPEKLRAAAYEDGPLPIGYGQTISQPYIVGIMTQAAAAEPLSSILEIGTGSGYAAAVLSRIAKEVYTIERIPELAQEAESRFVALGYDNIHVKIDDGTLGWLENAPFDAIIVTAAAPALPEPLLAQLRPGGRLVIPVGSLFDQELFCVQKTATGECLRRSLGAVRFVPLIGEQGWQADSDA